MKNIFKIIIFILILLLFLQKIYNSQTKSNANEVQQTVFLTKIPKYCRFETELYTFEVGDCIALKLGKITNFVGSVDPSISSEDTMTDSGFFSKKRLIVRSINHDGNLWLSPLLWPGYFSQVISGFKNERANSYLRLLESDVSYLIGNLSLGFSPLNSKTVEHLFKVTGTQYLASISGFHLNLVVGFFAANFLKKLSKRARSVGLIMFSGLFLLFIGIKIPLARAFLMLFFCLLSNGVLKRQSSSVLNLFWSGIFLIYNDISSLNTISFQLSYVATLSIILFGKLFKSGLLENLHISAPLTISKNTDKSRLIPKVVNYSLSSLKIGIYVSIALIPLLAYHFGEVSLITLIVSVLLTWLVPVIVLLGLALFILSLLEETTTILSIFALPLVFVSQIFLSILKLFNHDIFLFKTGEIGGYTVLIYWVFLLITFFTLTRKKRTLSLVKYLKI